MTLWIKKLKKTEFFRGSRKKMEKAIQRENHSKSHRFNWSQIHKRRTNWTRKGHCNQDRSDFDTGCNWNNGLPPVWDNQCPTRKDRTFSIIHWPQYTSDWLQEHGRSPLSSVSCCKIRTLLLQTRKRNLSSGSPWALWQAPSAKGRAHAAAHTAFCLYP